MSSTLVFQKNDMAFLEIVNIIVCLKMLFKTIVNSCDKEMIHVQQVPTCDEYHCTVDALLQIRLRLCFVNGATICKVASSLCEAFR